MTSQLRGSEPQASLGAEVRRLGGRQIVHVVENLDARDTEAVWYSGLAAPPMGQEVARVSPRRRESMPRRGSRSR